MEACPACRDDPERKPQCTRCEGAGWVAAAEAGGRAADQDEPPEVHVLEAWAGIQRYGLAGWLELERSRLGNRNLQPHPELRDALAVIDAELDRLETLELGNRGSE
jgi:hypothetical protein